MRRVVLVTWGFAAFGGMERHVVELALGLARAGHAVAVASEMPVGRGNAYAARLRAAGIALHRPPLAWRALNAGLLALAGRRRRGALIHGGGPLSARLRRTLARLTRGGEALVHVHGCRLGQAWVVDWARSRGVASVYTEHVDVAAAGGPVRPEAPAQAARAGLLACVSDHSRGSLAALYEAPPPIVVTGHIVAASAAAAAGGGDRLHILCPARLAPHKGVDVLLRAFATLLARHPGARLSLAGAGPERARLARLARDLSIGGAVRFAGRLSPAAMADAVAAADIVALPSLTEALPLVLLEAQAAGVAVVASRVGGVPELVSDGSDGLLVAPGDADGLAAALDRLALDPALRRRLGAAGRRRFDAGPHHAARVVPAMQGLYAEAAARC